MSLTEPIKMSHPSASHGEPLICIGQMGGLVGSILLEHGKMPVRGVALDNDFSYYQALHSSMFKFSCDADGSIQPFVPDGHEDAMESINLQELFKQEGTSAWVLVLVGLGGVFSDQIIPQVVSSIQAQGSMVVVVASLPFDMEGEAKTKQAEKTLDTLLQSADAVIAIPNQALLKEHASPVKMKTAFELSRTALAQAVDGVWEMLRADGLTNIEMSHLKDLFQGHHVKGLFASGQAAGFNRAKCAVESLLGHPQMEDGAALALADACLLQITGDESLTFKEVDRIERALSRLLPAGISPVVGTSVCGTREGWLSIRLVSAHFSQAKENLLHVSPGEPDATPDSFKVTIQKKTPLPQEAIIEEEAAKGDAPLLGGNVEDHDSGPINPLEPPLGTRSSQRGSKRYFQTLLNLGAKKKGRFASCDPTYYHSINLDEPTFQRKGVLFN
ncbi:hypothetical protein N8703_03025 [Verrucomicrobia bacterium]|nr:hypothetical protein [Verrucomicrobiota bacterium]